MGTRNLTAVMVDGQYKLAQYGQWDGYPDGQGVTALEFCRIRQAHKGGWEHFKEQLKRVRFATTDEVHGYYKSLGADDSGFVTMDISNKFDQNWPYFSRDHGAKILELVDCADQEVLTNNSIDFAGDSLFCEWAYVIDLDAGTFEVYKGFNKQPVPEGQRFAGAERGDNQDYYQVVLLAKFGLDKLPNKAAFLKECKVGDEDAA